MGLLPTSKTPPKSGLEDFTILIYGKPKIGKTTFANQFGNTLFLATEAGLAGLDAYQIPVNSWDMFKTVIVELSQSKHDFKTVCIDTIDNLYKFCCEWGCKSLNIPHQSDAGFGKGYDVINSEFLRELTKLSLQPTGLLMISHVKEKEIKPRAGIAYSYFFPTLPEAARKIVLGMADIILYLDTTFEQTGDTVTEQRTIHTKPSNNYEAGGRIDYLPSSIPLDFTAFQNAFLTGAKLILCEQCSNAIERTDKMSAWTIGQWSKQKYNKSLCVECIKKIMEQDNKKEATNNE